MSSKEVAITETNTISSFQAKGNFLKELKDFLRENMVKGIDYGIIVGSKPTLLKPGAEKLLNYFNYSASFSVAEKLEDHEKGYFFYKYSCTVSDKDGRSISDGFGSANTKERKWASQSAFDVLNTVDKMAQKRALMQATLLATRASEFYTQDLEDMPPQIEKKSAVARQEKRSVDPTTEGDIPWEREERKEGIVTVESIDERASKTGKGYRLVRADSWNYYLWNRKIDMEVERTYKIVYTLKGNFTTIVEATLLENGEEVPF